MMPLGYVYVHSGERNTASIHMPRVIRMSATRYKNVPLTAKIFFTTFQKYCSSKGILHNSNFQLNRASRVLFVVVLLIHRLLQVPSLGFVLPTELLLAVQASISDILLQLVGSELVGL